MPEIERSHSSPIPKSSKTVNHDAERVDDKECSNPCALSLTRVLCALKSKEEEVLVLTDEITVLKKKCEEFWHQLRQVELLKNEVAFNVSKISRENETNVDQIKKLEKERNGLVKKTKELQSLLKSIEEGTSENMDNYTEKILMQQQVIEKMRMTNTKLAKEVARLVVENKKHKDQTIQSTEMSRIEIEKEVRKADKLSVTNRELEKQVAEAVERMIFTEGQASFLQRELEALEQQNLLLHEENEDVVLSLNLARDEKAKSNPRESPCVRISRESSVSDLSHTPLSINSKATPPALVTMLDECRTTSECWSRDKYPLHSLGSFSETRSPCQFLWKETPRGDESRRTPNEYLWKETPKSDASGYVRKVDVLEEFLYLSASAARINFPTVSITSEELIQEARKLPYHKVQDALRAKMESKLQEQNAKKKKSTEKLKEKAKFYKRLFTWSSPQKNTNVEKKQQNSYIKVLQGSIAN